MEKVDSEYLEEIFLHLEGILNDADRMTSGNFMHNKCSIKFRVKMIKQLLKILLPYG